MNYKTILLSTQKPKRNILKLANVQTFPIKEGERLKCYVWSFDKTKVAAGSSLGAFVYDAQTLDLLNFFPTNIEIKCLDFSPDGTLLAGGGTYSDSIWIWNTVEGNLKAELKSKRYHLNSVKFSPDGKFLATGTFQLVQLWNVSKSLPIYNIDANIQLEVNSLCFSPNGQFLAACSKKRTNLWDVSNGEWVRSFGNGRMVYDAVFSPNNKYFANGATPVAHSDTVLRVWDLDDQTLLYELDNDADTLQRNRISSIEKLLFSPESTYLAILHSGQLAFWDMDNQQLIGNLDRELLYKKNWSPFTGLTFSLDGQHIFTGNWAGKIQTFEIMWR